jgi:hypothetical protein
MDLKNEHIIVIILVLLVGWLIMSQTFENFNVIENRWAYPLTNEAGDLWTKEFDRPVTYSYPDGRVGYIPQDSPAIPKNPYKEQIYDGDFEIPQFNYEDMPVPKKASAFDVDETQGNFESGVSYDKMPESDGQQHYMHLKRQMQTQMSESSDKVQATEAFSDSSYEYNDNQFSTLGPVYTPLDEQMPPQIPPQMQQMQKQMEQEMKPQMRPRISPQRPAVPRKNVIYVKGRSNSNMFTVFLLIIIAVLIYYIYAKK